MKKRSISVVAAIALIAVILKLDSHSTVSTRITDSEAMSAASAVVQTLRALYSLPSSTSSPKTETENDISELASLGNKVLDTIPSKNQIQTLSEEEVHTIARPIFEASLGLKRYSDRLEDAMNVAIKTGNTAQVAAQGADFYEKCATREDAPESIRAVCFIEFTKMSAKSGHPENIERIQMPHEIIQIALEIAPSAYLMAHRIICLLIFFKSELTCVSSRRIYV